MNQSMRKRTKRSVRIAILVFILASAVVAFKQAPAPAHGAQARPQEGSLAKEALQKVCGKCHTLERVTASRRSRAQWEESVAKMITLGAKGTDEEFATILSYLVRQYGRVDMNSATPDEISEVVGLSVKDANLIVKYRQEIGKFDNFDALSKTPGVDVGKLEKNRDAISLIGAQTPPGRSAGGQGPAPPPRSVGGGAGPADKHVVDAAAADRGRKIWAAECIACHGSNSRGSERGANLVRSELVLRDRNGSEIGPYLHKGHHTQSGASSANFSQAQIEELAHFIHQRVYDTLRGSPIFEVQNVLTGDPKAGEAYFNGEGKCNTCHSPTGDLAGIGKKYNPATLQQRFLFPRIAGGRGRGAPPSKPVTLTVTPPSGAAVSGVLVHLDDFNVSLRDASGEYHSWKRTPELKVVKNDPFAAHIELLDKYTDKNMHDIVAYLESLK
jgi:competence ComEA-like helix-hairpin-helix protein